MLAPVDRDNPTPRYLQAREILRQAIREGTFRPGHKLPSTADIGALCNVSLITAHKALEGLVSSGWVRREVGRGTYVCDDLIFATGDEQPLSVALILEPHITLNDYYHQRLISGLRQAAQDAHRPVDFFFHDHYDVPERPGKVHCAICVHPPAAVRRQVEKLAAVVPTVVLGANFPEAGFACVDCDSDVGTREAVRHLLELGHEHLVVLGGPERRGHARDRARAALEEIHDAGCVLAGECRLVSDDLVGMDAPSRNALQKLLASDNRPTAIVGGGYYLTLSAMQVVHQAGLRIPEDVSVVGFDDPPSAPLLWPPLTTVQQPLIEMAGRAFTLVGREDELPGASDSITLPTRLVVRASTGPRRAPRRRKTASR